MTVKSSERLLALQGLEYSRGIVRGGARFLELGGPGRVAAGHCDHEEVRRGGVSILDFVESEIAPFDPPFPKTLP